MLADRAMATLRDLLDAWREGMGQPLPVAPLTASRSSTAASLSCLHEGGLFLTARAAKPARAFPDFRDAGVDGRTSRNSRKSSTHLRELSGHACAGRDARRPGGRGRVQSEHLDPLTLPLRGSRLIEASAGTGKTWTIAALYLRLVLGHGETDADGTSAGYLRLLVPSEILVMTFTRAATRELSNLIRERLLQAARCSSGEPVDDGLRAQLDR